MDNSRNLGDYITEIENDDDEGIPGGSTTILVLASVRRNQPVTKCRIMWLYSRLFFLRVEIVEMD